MIGNIIRFVARILLLQAAFKFVRRLTENPSRQQNMR